MSIIQAHILGILLTTFTVSFSDPDVLKEFCEGQTFSAMCGVDEVVVMTHARYGRMKLGTCINSDFGHLGCSYDVISLMDKWCSGFQECEVPVSDLLNYKQGRPCPKDFRSYLEASYTCVKVTTPYHQCTGSNANQRYRVPVPPSGESRYLSSRISLKSGCGTTESPWLLEAQPGQRINISLYDFSSDHSKLKGGDSWTICSVYATVKDNKAERRTHTVCGTQHRIGSVYVSLDNEVEVRMLASEEKGHFLMEYKAIGCPDVLKPKGGWVMNQGNKVVVGCNASGVVRHLTCHGNSWMGTVPNCSSAAEQVAAEQHEVSFLEGILRSKDNLVVIIVFVAAVALVVGTLVVVIGVVVLRRRRGAPTAAAKQHSSYTNVDVGDVSMQMDSPSKYALAMGVNNYNPYFATWELRHHRPMDTPDVHPASMPQPRGCVTPPPPPLPLDAAGSADTMMVNGRHEHIYEDPKFIQRELDPEADDPAQYFVLDVDLVAAEGRAGRAGPPDRRLYSVHPDTAPDVSAAHSQAQPNCSVGHFTK